MKEVRIDDTKEEDTEWIGGGNSLRMKRKEEEVRIA